MAQPSSATVIVRLLTALATASASTLTGCSDVVGPSTVVGRYVLRAVRAGTPPDYLRLIPLPATLVTDGAGDSTRFVDGVLDLRAVGTWSEQLTLIRIRPRAGVPLDSVTQQGSGDSTVERGAGGSIHVNICPGINVCDAPAIYVRADTADHGGLVFVRT
jgi:hypothetical protein